MSDLQNAKITFTTKELMVFVWRGMSFATLFLENDKRRKKLNRQTDEILGNVAFEFVKNHIEKMEGVVK